jgi:hypothetical protein
MKVVFLQPARAELAAAKRYYDQQLQGLGKHFKAEAQAAAWRIADQPRAWQVERGLVRRCLLSKFPYKLLYTIRGDEAVVLAVAHLHRDPDYWLERLDLL